MSDARRRSRCRKWRLEKQAKESNYEEGFVHIAREKSAESGGSSKMFNYTKYCMPIATQLGSMAGETYLCFLIGYDQQKGLWILLEDGSVKTFYRDEIKEIKPISSPFKYKESHRVMRIRTMQSQQWNPDLLPKFELGKSQEFQFSGVGPTKAALERAERTPKGGMRDVRKAKSAETHWV